MHITRNGDLVTTPQKPSHLAIFRDLSAVPNGISNARTSKIVNCVMKGKEVNDSSRIGVPFSPRQSRLIAVSPNHLFAPQEYLVSREYVTARSILI
jgi:hypothetical protein